MGPIASRWRSVRPTVKYADELNHTHTHTHTHTHGNVVRNPQEPLTGFSGSAHKAQTSGDVYIANVTFLFLVCFSDTQEFHIMLKGREITLKAGTRHIREKSK